MRKREEKSYVESPDMIFEDTVTAKKSAGRDHALGATNGDVDMSSEPEDNENEGLDDDEDDDDSSDDSDDGKPLPSLPSPKVRCIF